MEGTFGFVSSEFRSILANSGAVPSGIDGMSTKTAPVRRDYKVPMFGKTKGAGAKMELSYNSLRLFNYRRRWLPASFS